MSFQIIPKFRSRDIIEDLHKIWFDFQAGALNVGKIAHQYMINYISNHKHRKGGTGKLEKSIDFVSTAGAGSGSVFWGIGTIANLPSYWYWANFGGQIPGGGNWRPVHFTDGNPTPAKKGIGTNKATAFGNIEKVGGFPPSPARPINYIQKTRARVDINLRNLIIRLKRKK